LIQAPRRAIHRPYQQKREETQPPPTFEQAFKDIDNVLWKEAGCTSELDYTEQSSWLLFLKYLDGLEQDKAKIKNMGNAGRNGREYYSPPTARPSHRSRC